MVYFYIEQKILQLSTIITLALFTFTALLAQPSVDNSLLFTPSNGDTFDEYGSAVAAGNEMVLVGAANRNNSQGAVYVLTLDRTTGNWSEDYIISPNTTAEGDRFGAEVHIGNIWGAIGAPNFNTEGAVFVYQRADAVLTLFEEILPTDTVDTGEFGSSVGMTDTVMVIGAYGDDTKGIDAGAAYVYRFLNGNWTQIQKIVPDDVVSEDHFGYSVDVYGDYIVVGAEHKDLVTGLTAEPQSGMVYVYKFNATTQEYEFHSNIFASDRAPYDYFGNDIAISQYNGQPTILVGAYGQDNIAGTNLPAAGAAYLYQFDGANWNETKIEANAPVAADRFGWAVDLDSTTVMIGAPLRNNGNGSAFLFQMDFAAGANFVTPTVSPSGDEFINNIVTSNAAFGNMGNAVSVSFGTAAIGSYRNGDVDFNTGSVFLYELLAKPVNVDASFAQFEDGVQIDWTDRSGSEDGFNIYRDDNLIATVGTNVTTYFDNTTTSPDTLHIYCVRAFNAQWGESQQLCDFGSQAQLNAPSDLFISYATDANAYEFETRIELDWVNQSSIADSFYVYKNQSVYDTIPITQQFYVDLAAASPNDYDYCIQAFHNYEDIFFDTTDVVIDTIGPIIDIVDTIGWNVDTVSVAVDTIITPRELRSGPVCGTGRALLPPPTSITATNPVTGSTDLEDHVVLDWVDASMFNNGFFIYRDGFFIDSVPGLAPGPYQYIDWDAETGVTHDYCITTYRVVNLDSTGFISESILDEGCTQGGILMDQPIFVEASDGDFETQIEITWADTSMVNESFRIYRDSILIVEIGDTDVNDSTILFSYIDTYDLQTQEEYEYCVASWHPSIGESRWSCNTGFIQIKNPSSDLCEGLPAEVAIPEGGNISSIVTNSGSGTTLGNGTTELLEVCVLIDHNNIGDLELLLTAPDGTTSMTLANGIGGAGDDFGNTITGSPVCFTFDALEDISTYQGGDEGEFKPQNTSTFTYEWFNVDANGLRIPGAINTTDNFIGTKGAGNTGVYDVIVTDGSGCQSLRRVELGQGSLIAYTTEFTSTDADCGVANGIVNVTINEGSLTYNNTNPGPYTVTWPDATTGFNKTGLMPGTYAIQITDATGCEKVVNVAVNEKPLNIVLEETPATCGSNGQIAIALAGATGTYNISYDFNGATTSVTGQTLPYNITGLSPGNYYVNVEDAANPACVAYSSIQVSSNALDAYTVVTSNGTGFGSTFDVEIVTTGGQAPLSFVWSDGDNNQNRTNLNSNQAYIVTVSDALTCSLQLAVQSTPFQVQATAVRFGVAKAEVQGQGSPFTFEWMNNTGTVVSNSAIATGLPAGNYAVEVTSDSGLSLMSNQITMVATNLNATSVTVNTTDVSCTDNGQAEVTVSYGGTFTYQWSDGQTTAIATDLAAGAYTVTVTDTNIGATHVENVTINNAPQFTYTIDPVTPPSACATADGTAGFGACAGCTYAWSDGDTNEDRTDLAAGLYTVTITSGGCDIVETVSIPDATAVNFTVAAATGAASCGQAIVTGAPAGSTYAWSNGQTTVTAMGLTEGQTYTVTVTNATCVGVQRITMPDALTIYFDITSAACTNTDGEAAASVEGGTAPYTYAWSVQNGGGGGSATTPTLTGLGAGTYTLTVTDAKTCTATASAVVTDALIYIVEQTNITSCGADDASATVGVFGEPVYTGGGGGPAEGDFTFAWSNGENGQTVTGLAAGTYTVTITRSGNGGGGGGTPPVPDCTVIETITITDFVPPTITLTATPTCPGEDSGTITSVVTGTAAPFTYTWSNSSTEANIANLPAGTYTVTVTDVSGCTAVETVTVNAVTLPVASATATPTSICSGNSSGSVTVTVTGGSGTYNYAWSNGTTGTPTINNLGQGNYSVTVTDQVTGCTDEVTATVTLTQGISANLINIVNAQCGVGGSATAAATGAATFSYIWSDGQTTPTATNLIAGTYFVTVTDAAAPACSVVRNVIITNPQAPVANIDIVPQAPTTDTDCNGSWSIELTANTNNPQSNFALFNGLDPNGGWTLDIADNDNTTNTDGGELLQWYMTFSDGDCQGGLQATDADFEDRVELQWVDASAVNDGYRIYRDGIPIKTIFDPNVTTFVDSINITSCEIYTYCIEAFSDIYGVSELACDQGSAEIRQPTDVNAFDGEIGLSGFCEALGSPTNNFLADFEPPVTSTITNGALPQDYIGTTSIDEVCVLIKHTFVGDLELTLSNGTSAIKLADRNGGSTDDFGDVQNGIRMCFSEKDPSFPSITNYPSAGSTATYQPAESFAGLTGSFFGDWTLTVDDEAGGDTGKFISWSISFTNNSSCLSEESLQTLSITWTDNSVVNTSYEIFRDGVRIGVLSDTTGVNIGETFVFYDQEATAYTLHNYCVYAVEEELGESKPGCDEGKRNAVLGEAYLPPNPEEEVPVVTVVPNSNSVTFMGVDVDIDGAKVAVGTRGQSSKSFVFNYKDESGNGVKKWYYDDVVIKGESPTGADIQFDNIEETRGVAISGNYLWTGGAQTSSGDGVATAHNYQSTEWQRTGIKDQYDATLDGYTVGKRFGNIGSTNVFSHPSKNKGIAVAVDGNTAAVVTSGGSATNTNTPLIVGGQCVYDISGGTLIDGADFGDLLGLIGGILDEANTEAVQAIINGESGDPSDLLFVPCNLNDDANGFAGGNTFVAAGNQPRIEIYNYETGTWNYQQTLQGGGLGTSNTLISAYNSLAIDGNFLIAGMPNDNGRRGRFAIYNADADGNFNQEYSSTGAVSNGFLGWSVAIQGDVALVSTAGASGGSLGEVRVLERSAATNSWVQIDLLQQVNDPFNSFDMEFGYDIAYENDFIAIGAPAHDNSNGADAGAVFVYKRVGNQFERIQKLVAADGQSGERFGESVAIDNGFLIIGAPRNSDTGIADRGAFYAYYLFDEESLSATDGLYDNRVTLSWTAVQSNYIDDILIYRDGELIDNIDPTNQTYDDENAIPGKVHQYTIAIRHIGEVAGAGSESTETGDGVVNDDRGMKVFATDYGFMRSGGKISGTVTSEGDTPIPNVEVCAEVIGALYALDFDGQDDYVEIQKPLELNNTSFTIEAWVKRKESAAQDIFITQGNSAANGFSIGFRPNNDFVFEYSTGGGATNSVSYNAGTSLEWQHWALSYDTTGIVQIYRNAELVSTQAITGFFSSSSKVVELGRAFGGADYFNGTLRDVRVWTQARSGVEIEENINSILKGTENNLLAYWQCSAGNGFLVGDFTTGGAYHGIIRFAGDESDPITGASACWTYATPTELQYCDMTDASGYYEITNIFFGNEAEVTVKPSGVKVYDPEQQVRLLNLENFEETDVNFIDTAVFKIKGKVTTPFIPPNQEPCPVAGMELWYKKLNSTVLSDTSWISSQKETAIDGSFEFVLSEPGEYAIRPRYVNETVDTTDTENASGEIIDLHEFDPASRSYSIFGDIDNVNFDNIQTNTLYVRTVGPCEGNLGTSNIQISSTNGGCYNTTITTTGTGYTAVPLPPLEYNVLVTNVVDGGQVNVGAVTFLETRPQTIDLKDNVDSVTFVYNNPYKIKISDPTSAKTCPPLADAFIMKEGTDYPIQIEVFQVLSDGSLCPADTGTIQIVDNITGVTLNEEVFSPADQGSYFYTIVAGDPNIVPPYTRSFTATAIVDGAQTPPVTFDAIVEGKVAQQSTFITTTKNIPMIILRQPPGNASSASIGMGQQMCSGSSFSLEGGTGVTSELEFKVGAGATYGITSEFELSLEGTGSEKEIEVCVGATQEVSTPGGPPFLGADGDVYMGAGLNWIFAITDDFKLADCGNVTLSQSFEIEANDISTTYIYPQVHITEFIIPELEQLKQIAMDNQQTNEVFEIEKGIKTWQDIIEMNANIKDLLLDKKTNFTTENVSAIFNSQTGEVTSAYNGVNRAQLKLVTDNAAFQNQLNEIAVITDTENGLADLYVESYSDEITAAFEQGAIVNFDKFRKRNTITGTQVPALVIAGVGGVIALAAGVVSVANAGAGAFVIGGAAIAGGALGGTSALPFTVSTDDGTRNPMEFGLQGPTDEMGEVIPWPEISNFSYSAGPEFAQTIEQTKAWNTSVGIGIGIEGGFAFGTEFDDNSAGVGLGAFTTFGTLDGEVTPLGFSGAFSLGGGRSNAREVSAEISYTIADEDDGDFFSFEVVGDPFYGTPVFKVRSGLTSCPWEEGTAKRDTIDMRLQAGYTALQANIPHNEEAIFGIELQSFNQWEGRDINLYLENTSNPDAAQVEFIGGEEFGLDEYPEPGSIVQTLIKIERGPIEYNYDDITIIAAAPCEEDFDDPENNAAVDIINLSVHFQSPCSDINLFLPTDNWAINAASNDTLPIVISGYDLSNEFLTGIRLEWRNVPYDTLGAESPLAGNIIDILTPSFLQNFNDGAFYTFNWNTAFLPDGEYEIRAKTLCAVPGGSATNSTPWAEGIIDRETPMLLGSPQPADGIYNNSDDVLVTFNEPIYCGSTNALDFFIDVVDITTGDTLVYANSEAGIQDSTAIEYDIVCNNDQDIMQFVFEDIWQYEGHLLQVVINNGFQDMFGNALPEPLSWSFVVMNQNIFWNPQDVVTSIYEGDTFETTVTLQNTSNAMHSFQLNTDSLPSWLATDPVLSNNIAPNGSQDVNLYVNLFDNMVGDSTYTANLIAYVDENAFIDGNGDGILDNDTTYTEILPISVEVKYDTPEWDYNPAAWAYNMTFVLEVDINGIISTDEFDQVTAIVDGEVRGLANVEYVPVLDSYLVFMSVGSNDTTTATGEIVEFRVWDASSGTLYSAVETFPYEYGGIIGDLASPQIIHAGNELAQCIDLVSGWNFISFNVTPVDNSINNVLEGLSNVTPGDFIKTDTLFAEFVNSQVGWVGNLTNIDINKSYMIKLANADQLCVDGLPVDTQVDVINLEQGWNWIAYTAQEPTDLTNGLSSIGNSLTNFDYITTTGEFAQYDGTNWLGSLDNLEPGEGYKLFIQQPAGGTIAYSLPSWVVVPSNYRYNMNIIGEVEIDGFTALNEDDMVSAYINEGCRGVAQLEYIPELDKYIAFMTVHSNNPGGIDAEEIEFRIYDASADTIYTLPAAMNFVTEVKHGTTAEPYKFAISTCAPVSVLAINEDCAGANEGSASVVTELNCGLWNTPCVNPTTYVAGVDTDGQSNEDVSPFSGYWSDGKYEYLIRSEELRQNGFYGGTLTGISFEVLQKNSTQPYSNFSVRVKCADINELSAPGNFTFGTKLVYTGDYSTSMGTNTINFTDTYNWDGQSNLIVQICYDNSSFSNDDIIATSTTSFTSTVAFYDDTNSVCGQMASAVGYNKRPSMELVGCGVNYQWSDGQTTPVAVDLTPGMYSVLVSFPNGCEISRDVELTGVAGGALVAEAIAVEASCITGNDGAALLTVVGGTPPYSYEWSTGATTADLTGVTPGDYEVIVTDANNCATSMELSISDSGIAPITLSLTENDASCNGTADGSAAVVVTGSSAPYSYVWSNGSTSEILTDVTDGSYAVTVTDANGCVAEALAVIGSGLGGSVDIAFDQLYPVCDDVNNGMVYAEVTGGSGNYSYAWSNGSTEAFLSGVAAGTYDVTITDMDNGCSYESSYALVNSSDVTPLESAVIESDLISFYEHMTVTIEGGYGAYNFEWELISGYAQYSVATDGEISILYDPTAVWSLVVTDSDFCNTNSLTIDSSYGTPDPSTTPLTVSDMIVTSDNGSNTGSINLTVTGGNAPYTYAWSGGDLQGVLFGMGMNEVEGLSSGWYTVTVTDFMGNSTIQWVWVPIQSRGRGKLADGEVLLAISPNPVQSSTVITFAIPADDYVEIRLFNTQGKLLRTLHQGESLTNEVEQLSMNLGNLAKGVYFCELQSKTGYRAVTKVVVSR